MDEEKGDCFHCHGSDNNPLWTDNKFHNNGLDASFNDLGLGTVTGDPNDNGKFRSPTLRNLTFTAPYMHDGRFTTLEEVINCFIENQDIDFLYGDLVYVEQKNINNINNFSFLNCSETLSNIGFNMLHGPHQVP